MDKSLIISIIFSFIALVVSLLTFYFSQPKIKCKHIKTFYKESTGITDAVNKVNNEDYYIPNFILQISNPRDKGVTIDEVTYNLENGYTYTACLDINKTISAFSSSLFYFGPGAVNLFVRIQKGEIDRLKEIYKNIGLKFNNSEEKLNNHYPFLSGLGIPKKYYEINKKNENKLKLTINIKTAFKTFKVPLLLKYFKNNSELRP